MFIVILILKMMNSVKTIMKRLLVLVQLLRNLCAIPVYLLEALLKKIYDNVVQILKHLLPVELLVDHWKILKYKTKCQSPIMTLK